MCPRFCTVFQNLLAGTLLILSCSLSAYASSDPPTNPIPLPRLEELSYCLDMASIYQDFCLYFALKCEDQEECEAEAEDCGEDYETDRAQ